MLPAAPIRPFPDETSFREAIQAKNADVSTCSVIPFPFDIVTNICLHHNNHNVYKSVRKITV